MKNKRWGSLLTHCIPVVAMGIGIALGLSDAEIDGLEKGLGIVADGVAMIWGVVGVYLSHDKK